MNTISASTLLNNRKEYSVHFYKNAHGVTDKKEDEGIPVFMVTTVDSAICLQRAITNPIPPEEILLYNFLTLNYASIHNNKTGNKHHITWSE